MNSSIIIIGAGASGIAAGTKLIESGFKNVTILEAEDRIGGRVDTVPFAANVVDMGAQWCHGEVNNVVNELGKDHDLFASTKTKYDSFLFVKSNGEEVPFEMGEKLMKLVISIVENYKAELKTYKGSLGAFIVQKFQHFVSQPEFNVDPHLAGQFIEFFHKYENSIEASDNWYDASGEGYLHYWDCEGDRLLNWKDKGYKTVFDLLMNKYSSSKDVINIKENILFNKFVKNIIWKNRPDNLVQVTCSDNSTYEANHVIVTCSLGVLKENYQTMFIPELPTIKKNAIKGLTLGTVDKIYVEFEEPFWQPDWLGFSLLWNKDDLTAVQASKNSWIQDIFGFYTVDYQPNILCGWISGENARKMEMTEESEVREEVMKLLRMFLKNMTIPEPKNVKRSQWYTNPHFRGSYSYRSIATDLLKTSASDLALPLTNSLGIPAVQFAGEATHDHYYSTVHGAVESGWREAKRLADFYAKQHLGKGNVIVKEHYDVLILGAGISGLGAATVLDNFNLNYLVLEAQGKAGGRINTMDMINLDDTENELTNSSVDTGAQWLHGRQNYLYELAEKNNLMHSELSEEGLGSYIREDGFIFDEYFVKKIDFYIGQILEECEKFAQNDNLDEDYPSSVEKFLLDNFEVVLNNFKTDQEKIKAWQLLDWHFRFQIIDNACFKMDEISAKNWGKYSFNGESCQTHINLKKGFQSVVNVIIQKIDKNKISYLTEVLKIKWNFKDNKVLVNCSNNINYTANHVIITFSLGVLKDRLDKLFSPKLPDLHYNLISKIGFGTINKIFLQFESAWWQELEGIQLIWNDSNYNNLTHWTKYLSGFDIMKPGPENTLLGWVGGIGALKMEKLNDQTIINDCIQLLSKFTKMTVPYPKKFICSKWYSNPHIRGSYSFTSTACDDLEAYSSPFSLTQPIYASNLPKINDKLENENNLRQLIEDVDVLALQSQHDLSTIKDKPLMLFAGEACHEKYFSTVHGAYHSGVDQAKRLADFYAKKSHL